MKKIFLPIVLLFLSCTIFANSYHAETPPSTEKILGVWYSNTNREIKWEYKSDGKLYCFEGGKQTGVYTYTISNSCQGNNDPSAEFIKLVDAEKDEFCYKINKLNEGNNGILSIIGMHNQKEIIYVNDLNIKI